MSIYGPLQQHLLLPFWLMGLCLSTSVRKGACVQRRKPWESCVHCHFSLFPSSHICPNSFIKKKESVFCIFQTNSIPRQVHSGSLYEWSHSEIPSEPNLVSWSPSLLPFKTARIKCDFSPPYELLRKRKIPIIFHLQVSEYSSPW